jgi:hypothetical protein
VGEFNTLLSPIDRSSKEILDLNNTINQMDLIDAYRIFHPTTAQYIFFSSAHGMCSKINHILGHKASLNKNKKIEITTCILSDHVVIKLALNNKNNSRKYTNNYQLNNTFLNDQWVIEEIREEIKICLEVNENENTTYQDPWDTAKAVLRGKFIAMSACIKRTERSQLNVLMLHLKLLQNKNKQNSKQAERKKY